MRLCQEGLYQWIETVTRYLLQLSQPQAAVLALWSLGRVFARSCAVSGMWVALLEAKRIVRLGWLRGCG